MIDELCADYGYLRPNASIASKLTLLLMPPSNTKTASLIPKRRRKVAGNPGRVVVSPRLPRNDWAMKSRVRSGRAVRLQTVHHRKLRPLDWEEQNTRKLMGLVQARRDTVDRRTQALNQLTSLLKTYDPQALELTGEDLSAPLTLEFLRRWPDLIGLKAARLSTVRNFYYRNNVRRPELVEKPLKRIQESVALTTDEAVISVCLWQLKWLLERVGAFNKHIARFEAIDTAFASHADAGLFKELPGAGRVLAPCRAAAFGSDRTRYPDAASFQKYAGLAPVRVKSGGPLWTHWRWQAPVFLRQSLAEWAGQTVVGSAWAKSYYQRLQAKGKKHHVILRALAFKWVRILWKCWSTRTPYNEQNYLKALERKKSPNLAVYPGTCMKIFFIFTLNGIPQALA